MAATFYILVATACVAALFDQAVGQTQCTSVSWGQQSGVLNKLDTVYLTSGLRDWKIDIPKLQNHGATRGIVAVACDDDVAPDANFLDNYHLFVHRNGNLLGVGTVDVTEYTSY